MVADINLKYEVIRKLIHISSVAIPMYYLLYGNKNELIYICLVLCSVFLLAVGIVILCVLGASAFSAFTPVD